MSEDTPEKPKRKASKRPGSTKRGQMHREALKELNVHKPSRSARAADVNKMRALKDSLRESWAALKDKAQEFSKFSQKQHQFARHFALNGRSNKVAAMRLAGYDTDNQEALRVMANKNLAKPGMDDLIKAYEFEEKARMKLCVEDVVKWFQDIASAAMETQDFTNANRAMENLAKYLQMFVERKEVTHRVVQSREELDARIAELTAVLREAEPEIERKLRIN